MTDPADDREYSSDSTEKSDEETPFDGDTQSDDESGFVFEQSPSDIEQDDEQKNEEEGKLTTETNPSNEEGSEPAGGSSPPGSELFRKRLEDTEETTNNGQEDNSATNDSSSKTDEKQQLDSKGSNPSTSDKETASTEHRQPNDPTNDNQQVSQTEQGNHVPPEKNDFIPESPSSDESRVNDTSDKHQHGNKNPTLSDLESSNKTDSKLQESSADPTPERGGSNTSNTQTSKTNKTQESQVGKGEVIEGEQKKPLPQDKGTENASIHMPSPPKNKKHKSSSTEGTEKYDSPTPKNTDPDQEQITETNRHGMKRTLKTFVNIGGKMKESISAVGHRSSDIKLEYGMETWAGTMAGAGVLVFLLVMYLLQSVLVPTTALVIAAACAVLLVLPIAIIGWKSGVDRTKVLKISEPRGKTAGESLPFVTDRKTRVRNKASRVVALVAQNAPGKIVHESKFEIDEIFEMLLKGTRQDNETAVACSDALMYFSRDYPDYASSYEDDFNELLENARDPVKGRIAVAMANETINQGSVNKSHTEAIKGITNSHDPDARKYAAIALGILATEDAIKELRDLSTDSHPDVREEAERALEGLRT